LAAVPAKISRAASFSSNFEGGSILTSKIPETLDCRAFIRVRKRHKWPSKGNNSVTLFRFTEIDGGLSVSEGRHAIRGLFGSPSHSNRRKENHMKMRILLNKMVLNGTLLALGTLAPLAGAAPSIKSFRIPTANSEPEGITLGSDGNMCSQRQPPTRLAALI
jgi:hypothetical protein